MEGLRAQLTTWVHLHVLILLNYIYKQCNSMQGLCAQLTTWVHLPLYINIYNIYIYIYIYIYIIYKTVYLYTRPL